MKDQVTDWVSDHKWIKYKLVADEVLPKIDRDPRKTNWDPFLDNLIGKLHYTGPQTQVEIGKAVEELKTRLLNAYKIACPLRKSFVQKTRFWSNTVEKLRKKSRIL